MEYEPFNILQLHSQAENIDWESSDESAPPVPSVDDQVNSELMTSTSLKLKNMLAAAVKDVEDPQDIDITAMERLENEAFLFSTMST